MTNPALRSAAPQVLPPLLARFDEELQSFRRKHAVPPLKFCTDFGRALLQTDETSLAETRLAEFLKFYPKNGELWVMHGIVLRRLGRPTESLQAYDCAAGLLPNDPMPVLNKVNVLFDLNRSDEALASLMALAEPNPNNHDAQRFIGNAYVKRGELKNAIVHYENALRLKPDDVASWIDRIKAATDFENHEDAIATVNRAIEALPDNHRLIEARIMVYRRAGRFKEAEQFLQAALDKDPNDAWAHFQMAETVGRFDRQKGNFHYKRAVELAPENAIYWMSYANSLDRSRYGKEADHIQKGYDAVLKALAIGNIPSRFIRMARNILVRMGRFDLVKEFGSFRDLGRTWASESLHDALHYHLARVETDEDRYEILEQHRIWGRIEEAKAKLNPLTRPPIIERRSKIRLGIMSSDLRNHPVAYFAMPLFDYFDHENFELYCYSWSRYNADPVQKYLESRSNAFRWHKAISDRDAAQLIANDKLDLLFELGSSTDMNRLEVMAYRPAPLQASWLGYPHSAGLETIDYILVDPFINPPDPKLLIEKPFLMPKSWVAMGRLGFNEQEEINPVLPSKRNGFVTFGTANNPYKYSPTVLETWARTTAATDGAKFMFVRPEADVPAFVKSMTRAFATHGVDKDRLIFIGVRGKHMRWYNEIDISLDTFPQTGGTTTCESLFMGVPVISLVGTAFFERLSYSNLSNAGLDDLSCFSIDEYIRKATQLAADTERRKLLRTGLRYDIKEKPLGQPHLFARDFFDVLKKTVESHR
jgi:protein O-GlcNAc transferase